MKYRLLAPGPTPVPETVLTAMANPIPHHRTPKFEAVFKECIEGLKWLFQTEYSVMGLACSGTGAMEAAITNLYSPGDKILTVGGGKFGERWGDMAETLGQTVVRINPEWSEPVSVDHIKAAFAEHKDIRGVIVVASETSTGVRHPYEEIAQFVATQDDCLMMLDGITAAGVWDISPERDHIDILAAGSQKALMLPPGLGFLVVSDKAWKRAESTTSRSYYFDLLKERKSLAKNQTAYTPAVTLWTGLAQSLKLMREEGLQNIFTRHQRCAAAIRAGVQAMGLELYAKVPGDSVTSVRNPEGSPADFIYKGLRDRANISIAGGQDSVKGKIFRIANLGYFDELDMITVLGAIEVILTQGGYNNFTAGAGVGAAINILKDGFKEKNEL